MGGVGGRSNDRCRHNKKGSDWERIRLQGRWVGRREGQVGGTEGRGRWE